MGIMAVRTFLGLRMGMEAASVPVKGVGMARPAELLIGGLEKTRYVRGMGAMTLHAGAIPGKHMGMGSQHLLSDPGMTAQT